MIPNYTEKQLQEIFSAAGREGLRFDPAQKQRALHNPVIAPYLAQMQAAADKWRSQPIYSLPFSYFKLFETTGDRFFFEDSDQGYFPRRGRLAVFGLLYYLYERSEDLAQLEDIIWAVCDEYTWSLPAHLNGTGLNTLQNDGYMIDLFASETGSALAEILAMVGDRLSPIVVSRARALIKERLLDRYLVSSYGWETAKSNWAAVCAGSLGITAMYELADDALLAREIHKLLPAMTYFLQSFAADGTCLEGVGYWNYGFGYFVSFAQLLYRRTNGKIDLFDDPLVEKIALFQQKTFLPGGKTVCFSDGSSEGSFNPGLTAYLKTRYSALQFPPQRCCMTLAGDHCYRFALMSRSLLWAPDTLSDFTPKGAYALPAAQWYLASSQNGIGLAAKAGHNDEPHNHNDVGSFHLYKNGETLLEDFGSGEYTRDYFGQKRYTYYVCGSQGHSLPLINGCTQKPGREHGAANVQVDDTGIRMDIAPAYELDGLQSLTRDIRFDTDTGQVTLTDEVQMTAAPESLIERFITPCDLQVGEGRVHLRGENARCDLVFDPKVFTVKITTADFVGHFGIHRPRFLLDLVAVKPAAQAAYRFTVE